MQGLKTQNPKQLFHSNHKSNDQIYKETFNSLQSANELELTIDMLYQQNNFTLSKPIIDALYLLLKIHKRKIPKFISKESRKTPIFIHEFGK